MLSDGTLGLDMLLKGMGYLHGSDGSISKI